MKSYSLNLEVSLWEHTEVPLGTRHRKLKRVYIKREFKTKDSLTAAATRLGLGRADARRHASLVRTDGDLTGIKTLSSPVRVLAVRKS